MRNHHAAASFVSICLATTWLSGAPLDDDLQLPPTIDAAQDTEPTKDGPESIIRDTLDFPKTNDPSPSSDEPTDNASILALNSFRAGDMDACLSHLKTAVAKRPALPAPKIILAGFYLSVGDRRASRQLLEEEASNGAEHPQLYLSLAKLAFAEGRLADADVHYDKLESLDVPSGWSDEEKAWLKRSILEGRANLAESRGQWESAAARFAALHQLQPQGSTWQVREAKALFKASKFEQAYEELDIAFRRDPALGCPEAAMAVLHTQAQQYDEAATWYKRALTKYPNNPRVQSSYVMSLLYQNRATEAREIAEQLLEKHGSSAILEIQLGIIARQLGEFDAAKSHLEKALAAAPKNDEAHYQLIMTLAAMDEAARAEALQRAVGFTESAPNSSLALVALGAACHANGQFDRAEEALRKAATSSRIRPEGLFILGKVLDAQENAEDAAKVAAALKVRLDEPNVFVLRQAARNWVNSLVGGR